MVIAQRFVAGEEALRPAETSDDIAPKQSNQTTAFETDCRNLPYQTLRAHQRALSITALPSRARSALAALALTVDVRRPLASVFAHRAYLSNRAGISDRTWYRAEQDLVDAGLITVAEQGRKPRGGLYGAAFIHLTEYAAGLLGLVKADSVETEQNEEAPSAAVKPAPDFSPQPSATVADRFTYKVYLSPKTQEGQRGQVPEDVQPLLALGFRKNYLFKLMKIARTKHGKKLGDVVTACLKQLRGARFPISYLNKLLESTTDFAWLAKSQSEQAKVEALTAAQEAVNERTRTAVAGKTFFNQDLTKRFVVSTDGKELQVQELAEQSPRCTVSGWIQGFAEGLRSGSIAAATAEQHESFDTRRSMVIGTRPDGMRRFEAPESQRASPEIVAAGLATLRALLSPNRSGAFH